MPKLRIDTTTSIYEPIEVEIDGKAYVLRKLTRKELGELEGLDEKIKAGQLDAAYGRLELMFGPHEAFSKLDLSQVGEVVRFVVQAILNPEKREKNAQKPGDKAQP